MVVKTYPSKSAPENLSCLRTQLLDGDQENLSWDLQAEGVQGRQEAERR